MASPLAMGQLRQRLDSVMRATMQPDLPGAALLVVVDGKEVYRNGYGLANTETKTAISPETNFRMASVSKQFTAMGILLLEQAHLLSLDDPLARFFPTLPPNISQKVRIRHLLTHTSGLMDYEAVMSPNQEKQLLDANVLTLLQDRDSLYFEPGTQFRYSNSGFCLLALIIERVSKQPFAAFIQQRLFKPLGMHQSFVYETTNPATNRAMGYAQNQTGTFAFSDQSVTSATKGDGGVYTSLADYKKWIEVLRQGTLLDLNAALTRCQYGIDPKLGSYYGLGWFFQQHTHRVLFHSGSTCGFNNYVITIPDKNFLMAYFSNRAMNKPNAERLVKILTEAGYQELVSILNLDELTR